MGGPPPLCKLDRRNRTCVACDGNMAEANRRAVGPRRVRRNRFPGSRTNTATPEMAPLESSRRFLSFEWVEGTHLLWTGGRTHKSTFINMTHFRIQQLEVVTPIPDFVWRLAEALPRNQNFVFSFAQALAHNRAQVVSRRRSSLPCGGRIFG